MEGDREMIGYTWHALDTIKLRWVAKGREPGSRGEVFGYVGLG